MNEQGLRVIKDIFFGKQKFDVKQFMNSMWQLIISTSNATLEVPSLRP